MDVFCRTFAVFFLLFAATSCAPRTPLQDAWASVRNSAQELHQIAKNVSAEARSGSKDINNVLTNIAWIEAEDKCDPETLKNKPETCLGKIFSVSMNYSSALEKLSRYESCAVFTKQLIPAINTLQEDMGTCLKLNGQPVVSNNETIRRWEIKPLCLYTLERLFSFSILTARVFAVGDPAHHTASLHQKCA